MIVLHYLSYLGFGPLEFGKVWVDVLETEQNRNLAKVHEEHQTSGLFLEGLIMFDRSESFFSFEWHKLFDNLELKGVAEVKMKEVAVKQTVVLVEHGGQGS